MKIFDDDWLLEMELRFTEKVINYDLNGKFFQMTTPARLCDVDSRLGIDPTDTEFNTDSTQIEFFVKEDFFGNKGPFVLTEEPHYESNDSTDQSTIYGVLAWGFRVNSQGIAQDELNSVLQVLDTAQCRQDIANVVIGGPVNVGKNIGGVAASRISEATVAGELQGTVRHDLSFHVFSNPVFIPPVTTFRMKMLVQGSQFAAVTPAVTGNFFLTWNLTTFVATGAFSRQTPMGND